MKIESVVHKILREDSYSRGDDFYLYGKVLSFLFPEINDIGVIDFFLSSHIGAPAIETVTRARRKLQAKHDNLKPDEEIKKIREQREIEMRKYALD